MFGLFGGDDGKKSSRKAPPHSEFGLLGEVEDELSECGARDLRVDHLSDRNQPEKLGGGIPDASFDHPGPGKTYIEVDSGRGRSKRDREQLAGFERALELGDRLIQVTEFGSRPINEDDGWF